MKKHLLLLSAALFSASWASARPLLTEEPETLGKLIFEAGASFTYRQDKFNDPEIIYRTTNFPVEARIGVSRIVDAGFFITYTGQRLETGDANFSGSRTGMFSPLLKVTPWKNLGFMAIWHASIAEEGDQNLPVTRGDDIETKALIRLADAWPTSLNVGYLARGKYKSKLGVASGPSYNVEPGDVMEAQLSMEIPIPMHFYILTELAYYDVASQKFNGQTINNSAGQAADALVGINWEWGGWAIGTGLAFGLLDESHTSFDLERGAGDIAYKFSLHYKLKPRKPGQ